LIPHLSKQERNPMETLDPRQPDDTGRMAAIRDLLAHFDWEYHDRQLALEAIDRIADPGWDGTR
jgi:hypothetical protein